MNKTKIKNQKPIDYDVHFKYRCPNNNCSADHWKSLTEVSVKNFKIVCYCGLVIRPKQIKNITINYKKTKIQTNIVQSTNNTIPPEILAKCVGVLVNYGFTSTESEELIISTWIKNPNDNCALLIKNTLENIGVNNVKPDSTI